MPQVVKATPRYTRYADDVTGERGLYLIYFANTEDRYTRAYVEQTKRAVGGVERLEGRESEAQPFDDHALDSMRIDHVGGQPLTERETTSAVYRSAAAHVGSKAAAISEAVAAAEFRGPHQGTLVG